MGSQCSAELVCDGFFLDKPEHNRPTGSVQLAVAKPRLSHSLTRGRGVVFCVCRNNWSVSKDGVSVDYIDDRYRPADR